MGCFAWVLLRVKGHAGECAWTVVTDSKQKRELHRALGSIGERPVRDEWIYFL